jgi:hypothetical protein
VSALVVMAAATSAHANPLDIVGLGSRRAGVAQSGVASVDDMAALYYDPAGLVIREDSEVAVGITGAYSHLALDRVRAPFADGGGVQLGVRAHLHKRFAVGIATHAASDGTQLVVRDPAVPFYPQFRDRLSRSVLLAGAAIDLQPAAVGVSFDLTDGFEHARAIVGATYKLGTIRIGAAYHQRFALAAAHGTARLHYTPHRVDAGITYTEGLVASLDVGWAHWSAYRGPFERERIDYEDAFTVRFGLESGTTGTVFRGGYSFESSSVETLADGPKHTLAGGVGYTVDPLRVDAHVSVEIVGTRLFGNPEVKSGGEVFGAGLTLTAGF